jgi:hypothetical protein
MHIHRRLLTMGIAALVGTASAAAPAGTWEVTGRYTIATRYDGHVLRGQVPFAVHTTLDPDGSYEVTGPNSTCGPSDAPPVPTSGHWSGSPRAFLAAIVRRSIRSSVLGCGGRSIAIGGLASRLHLAQDATTLDGRFSARVRYHLVGRHHETFHARIHGAFTGARTPADSRNDVAPDVGPRP